MSPFPQSVADSSTSPAGFLLPPAVIQVAFVHLGVLTLLVLYSTIFLECTPRHSVSKDKW